MVKKGDFIELNYTGRTTDGIIFDTTDSEVAKKEQLNPKAKYAPVVICLGQGQILQGMEEQLDGKAIGTYTLTLPPEKAFGKKNAKLIQLVSTAKFLKDKIQPQPGLQVNIDGKIATVRRVSGGRTLVDFNHPLSGLTVEYVVDLRRVVTDLQEKTKAVVHAIFGVDTVSVTDGVAQVTLPKKMPEGLEKTFKDQIQRNLPELKDVVFKEFIKTKS